VGHASRSSGMLRRARVSWFASKLTEERRRVVHVVSSWRSCEVEEDGRVNVMSCIGLFYPYFAILEVLGPRGILVF
jgi:hypothetical protein